MKKHLRSFLINLLALQVAISLNPGFSAAGGFQTLLISSLVLSVVNQLIKPIINLLFLPINLITLGAFRWLVNVSVIFLITLIVSNLRITGFIFSGLEYQGFIVPEFAVSKFWSLALSSVYLSLTNIFLLWLIKDK